MTPATHPKLNDAVGYAIHYFHDFVLPEKKFRDPTNEERKALRDLRDALSNLPCWTPPFMDNRAAVPGTE